MHPAFDCPTCPRCGLATGTADNSAAGVGELFCTVCEHVWEASGPDLLKAQAADDAHRALVDEVARAS